MQPTQALPLGTKIQYKPLVENKINNKKIKTQVDEWVNVTEAAQDDEGKTVKEQQLDGDVYNKI